MPKKSHTVLRVYIICVAAALAASSLSAQGPWLSHCHDPQHTGLSQTVSQCLSQIRWQVTIDSNPPGTSILTAHYGSPIITPGNTVIVPVRGPGGLFHLEARNGATGALIWSQNTDYVDPPYGWVPAYGAVLTTTGRLYFPGAGGTVYFRDNVDNPTGPSGQLAFYGLATYQASQSSFDSTVKISTPITADADGNIFFGFAVTATPPAPLTSSGLARISSAGVGTWVTAFAAGNNDSNLRQVTHNCAPAISLDGTSLYVTLTTTSGSSGSNGTGYLVRLNSTTLAYMSRVHLIDPKSGNNANLREYSTATPLIGPDSDVYFGVVESPSNSNHGRGWLLHYSDDLSQTKIPGAFGWDCTPSIVPASMVPSYSGSSTYLLVSKYNHYANDAGDGRNKVAILDPFTSFTEPISGISTMNEVLTIVGPTPDPVWAGQPNSPNAVKEWCINTAAVDPFTKSILVNNEDGVLYRWDMATNTLIEALTLTSGRVEAYTPTVIGPDGGVYAINDAILFSVGTAYPTDLNCDRHVDHADVEILAGCQSRSNVPLEPACARSDLDHDGDGDMDDFAILQRCHAGPNDPPPANCAN